MQFLRIEGGFVELTSACTGLGEIKSSLISFITSVIRSLCSAQAFLVKMNSWILGGARTNNLPWHQTKQNRRREAKTTSGRVPCLHLPTTWPSFGKDPLGYPLLPWAPNRGGTENRKVSHKKSNVVSTLVSWDFENPCFQPDENEVKR